VKTRPAAPLNALRTFEAAARHLSFNGAASELFVTPAAVSHQVKHLEEHLGVSLFQRNHRSVALTPEGAELAATVGELLGQLDLALDRARNRAPAVLRVTTMESFAAKWLVPRLHRFQQAFPDVRVRIDTSDEHADFLRGGFDVGIRYGAGKVRWRPCRFTDAGTCVPRLLARAAGRQPARIGTARRPAPLHTAAR